VAIDRDLIFRARCHALYVSERYYEKSQNRVSEEIILRTANKFLPYLLDPTTVLRIHISPMTFSLTDSSYHPTKYTDLGDGRMSVTMQDNEYVVFSADTMDADQNPTADTGLVWAVDNTALGMLTPSADGTQVAVSAVPGAGLGTVNLTLTDASGNVSPPDAITFTSGPTTSVGFTAGAPQPIPAGGVVPVPSGAAG
jgi:hypothetical protein